MFTQRNPILYEQILNMPVSKYKVNHFQDKDYRDLTASEDDFKHFMIKKELLDISCSILLNTIRAKLDRDDTFLKLNYIGNQFYSI